MNWGKILPLLNINLSLSRLQDTTTSSQEAGTLESIKTKIMIQGEIQNPTVIKLELTSESDLFFNYTCP